MKININIPLIKWSLEIFIIQTDKEIDELVRKVGEEERKDFEEYCDFGTIYGDTEQKKSIIAVSRLKKEKSPLPILSHEIRHAVDKILEYHSIKDNEMPAIITEYIYEKLERYFKFQWK